MPVVLLTRAAQFPAWTNSQAIFAGLSLGVVIGLIIYVLAVGFCPGQDTYEA